MVTLPFPNHDIRSTGADCRPSADRPVSLQIHGFIDLVLLGRRVDKLPDWFTEPNHRKPDVLQSLEGYGSPELVEVRLAWIAGFCPHT